MKIVVRGRKSARSLAVWHIAGFVALVLWASAGGYVQAAGPGDTGSATGGTVPSSQGAASGSGNATWPNLGKRIDVNLRTQTLMAYEGSRRVYTTRISSGVTKHPTVTGTFHVYAKLTSQRM